MAQTLSAFLQEHAAAHQIDASQIAQAHFVADGHT